MKGSEQMTLVGTEMCIGHVLEILRMNAPRGPLSLRLDHDRDSIVSNTSSASYAHGCRPNSYFVVNGRLLLVGEDKVLLAYGNVIKVDILCRGFACCGILACCTWITQIQPPLLMSAEVEPLPNLPFSYAGNAGRNQSCH